MIEQNLASTGAGSADLFEVADDFASVARRLHAGSDVDRTLELICAMAVARVPGFRHAGVSLVQHRAMVTRGATDQLPMDVDLIQYETHEGPCLDAVRTSEVVSAGDLLTEHRWPAFAPRAVDEVGVRTMMSFRLHAEDRVLGALNFYATEPNVLGARADDAAGAGPGEGDLARQWGRIYATHAALALSGVRARYDLLQALESRETISVAVGVLMARQGVGRQAAFDILRRASQRTNRKLRDVASSIAGPGAAVTPASVDDLIADAGPG